MKQNMNISLLNDFYGTLLTEKQRTALDMYHNMDFSLSEIAENLGVTRQCARDFIKKGETHLFEIEEKAGLCRKFESVMRESEKLRRSAEGLSKKSGEELFEAEKNILSGIDAITEIMEK